MSEDQPRLVRFSDGLFGVLISPQKGRNPAIFAQIEPPHTQYNRENSIQKFCKGTEEETRAALVSLIAKLNDSLKYEVVE